MATVAGKLTLEEFEKQFLDAKPYYEFWEGVAIQKEMPTWVHGVLQLILGQWLRQIGLSAGSEVRVKIAPSLEFVPDVIAVEKKERGSYAVTPPLIIIEILSEGDRAQMLWKKCRAYAMWGVPTIYIVDPEDRKVRQFDSAMDTFTNVSQIGVDGYGAVSVDWLWQEVDKEFRS